MFFRHHKSRGAAAGLAFLAGTALAPLAHAQQFVNSDFETGDLSGWTVATTFNGTTGVQDVITVDIDGPGPLEPSLAARFRVGNVATITDHQAGIDLFQPLNLAADTVYQVSFDWASLSTATANNADGGSYSVYAGGLILGTQSAGDVNVDLPKYGSVTGEFATGAAGTYDIGARITRGFLVSTPFQHMDNFTMTAVVGGACCFDDGSCGLASTARCADLEGTYLGDNTQCIGQCVHPGACCVPTGCTVVSADHCAAISGAYQGNGTTCAGAACPAAAVNHLVVPPSHEFTDGGFNTTHLTHQSSRTVQLLYAASQIPIAIGSEITGITWRIASSPTLLPWPAVETNWTRFDIEVASAAVTPAEMSVIFNNNIGPDAVMVRAGALTIPAESFAAGTAAPGVNDWGPVIHFTTPFIYAGGDLVITIRHSGNSSGATRNIDSIATINTAAGYGSTLRALGATSDSVINGAFIGAPVSYITFGEAGADPCYANCDNSTVEPVLNVEDFVCFISAFASGVGLPPAQQINHYANCDDSTTEPVLNVEDFICFISEFAQGCP